MHVEGVDVELLTDYMRTTQDFRFKKRIEQAKQDGAWNFDYDIFISVQLCRNDVFMINTIRQVGVDGTNARSVSDALRAGREESRRLLQVMRTYFPGFANASIRTIAPSLGIRETRRICGESVLRVKDLIDGTEFTDGIALSGYGWDMPHPKHPSLQPFDNVTRKSKITQIPFRCLIPKGYDNLLAVGRCISVEREVLGPVRVMGPCLAMGEAAGIAAALAKDGIFRAVDVTLLRERIVSHGGIVCME